MSRNAIRSFLVRTTFAAVCGLGVLSPAGATEPVEVEGMAAVPYSASVFSSRVDDRTRQQVLQLAEVNALDRYASGFSEAKYKLYQRSEAAIKANFGDYVTQPVIVDEGYKKDEKKYFVVIRATINANRIDGHLSGYAEVAQADAASSRIAISFLFVARSTSSVKQFDDRRTQVEIRKGGESGTQTEGVSGRKARYASSANSETVQTTGGNTVRQANVMTYEVSSPEDMNAAMSQVFSNRGIDVYDYRDVSAECGGTKPEAVYSAFSKSDMLSREFRKGVFDAAKRCRVNTFATGTLDIGMQDTDPVTGMTRVVVSVRTQVNDLSGPLPRVLASVGPVQYSGTGSDPQVAQRNALSNAARQAAEEICSQLRVNK